MALRTMKNMKEIDQATSTNPYSRGGLPPLDHGDDEEDVGEGGDPSSGRFGGVSPSNLRCCSLCFVFLCFCGALLPRTLRGHIYSDFYVKIRRWAKRSCDLDDRRPKEVRWRALEVWACHLGSFGTHALLGELPGPRVLLSMKK